MKLLNRQVCAQERRWQWGYLNLLVPPSRGCAHQATVLIVSIRSGGKDAKDSDASFSFPTFPGFEALSALANQGAAFLRLHIATPPFVDAALSFTYSCILPAARCLIYSQSVWGGCTSSTDDRDTFEQKKNGKGRVFHGN